MVGASVVLTYGIYDVASKIHANSKRNPNPHLVYAITSMDVSGAIRVEKYGITSRKDNVNGNNGRPAYQANKFNKMDPTRAYSWHVVTRTDGRASAKAIELFLVSQHVYLHKSLPPKQIFPLPVNNFPTFMF